MDLDVSAAARPSESGMRWLVLATAYFVLVLFMIGIFDLLVGLYELVVSGRFTDPIAVVELLDTVLLLLIIIEVHRTLLAYAREEPVIRIVIGAAIIAISREVIGFRVTEFDNALGALTAASALGILLAALIAVYFLIHRIDAD